MADTFESLDEFRTAMQSVMAMRRESLYRLVAGQPNAAKDWEEIKAMVTEAGFAVSWLSRELAQVQDLDHPPQPSNRGADGPRADGRWPGAR